MIKLFDRVRIKFNNVFGDVVDISESGNYIVEGDKGSSDKGAYWTSEYPLFDCKEEDLELIVN